MYGDTGLAIDGQIKQTGSKGLSFVRATMCQDEKKERADGAAIPRDIGVLLTEIEREPIPDRLLALAKELQDALARQSAETTKPRKRS